ncbi:hypothetical protein LAG90_02800 [Marinilongibacter aquaticus]|uniref:hypothetical protein n=1 Tax=Marinilongibacter aquaticus TaxID=2975157 RepID=UPI0021BD303B|nr:hypothetical protein [Marinilongibacter aquaticus]UBM59583.1 hypothetical protein LAG90_02800 [Marinilongibacter aquaticus]
MEWLDLLITVTLNPTKTNVRAITNEQLNNIINRIPEENLRLQKLIKTQVFSITKEEEIVLLIKQYHSSLIALLDQTLKNQKEDTSQKVILKKVYKVLLSNIDELLSFIETRFSTNLILDERVPKTYLSVTRKELKKKLDKLKLNSSQELKTNSAFEIILKRLYHFINSTCLHYEVTFRDIFYKKTLVQGLEEIDCNNDEIKAYSALDEFLIYLNFNSKAYINLLTDRLAGCINGYKDPIERMDRLLYYYKAFNQLHRKPGLVLNPNYHDLETILGNWFTQEILYLEKKLHLSVVPLQGKKENPVNKQSTPKDKQKVLCMLSTDQIGLILRASDELRILVAKSMSQVFKTIVPHLSTPYKEDLSYDGMRSKSYVAEERDKQIAIETLERIIKKIKEY